MPSPLPSNSKKGISNTLRRKDSFWLLLLNIICFLITIGIIESTLLEIFRPLVGVIFGVCVVVIYLFCRLQKYPSDTNQQANKKDMVQKYDSRLLDTWTKASKEDIDEIIILNEKQIKLYLKSDQHHKATDYVKYNVPNHIDNYYVIEYEGKKIGYIYKQYTAEWAALSAPLLYPEYCNNEIRRALVFNANCSADKDKPAYVFIYTGDTGLINLYKRSEFTFYSQNNYFCVLRFVHYNMWWM